MNEVRKRRQMLLAVSAAAALAMPLLASAAGELDPSFGTGGKVLSDFSRNDTAYAVLVQPDGKVVAVGETQEAPTGGNFVFGLARYTTDGSLDASFGAGGKVLTAFTGFDHAFAAALQSDGRIVVAGSAGLDFGLARYQPDGALDAGFGAGGTAMTDFGSNYDQATAVAVGEDGKLYARTPKGRVLSQKPGAGARFAAGAAVRLIVSRGPGRNSTSVGAT
jgi:uncharacterized delta-60 repeat protein